MIHFNHVSACITGHKKVKCHFFIDVPSVLGASVNSDYVFTSVQHTHDVIPRR